MEFLLACWRQLNEVKDMNKLKTHRKGGKHHNLQRSARNKETHKYAKQAMRTPKNKARHVAKAKKLLEAAIESRGYCRLDNKEFRI
jgi:hypothetical protein